MRIAILGDALDLQYAGIHVYLRGLLNALVAFDRDNEYLLVRPKPGGEFPGMKEIVLPVERIPGHQRWRTFRAIPQRLIREGVDIVVEPAHFGPFGLPETIKRITVIHDLTPILFPDFHIFPSSLVHKLALPGILRKADRIIANSVHTLKDLEVQYPVSKGKTFVVKPGIEDMFRPVHDRQVLKKYGIRQPYLLCVGTIEPRKNLLTLLEAYELFRQQWDQPLQLVFAGKKGWKNRSFFSKLESMHFRNDVVLTGYTKKEDLPVLYSMSSLFVYPSWYEGFGLPVLEAMACGAPVLISDRSSLPEVGGRVAEYFSPDAPATLAEKLLVLMKDKERRRMMSELSEQQARQFSWEQAATDFLTVLKSIKTG